MSSKLLLLIAFLGFISLGLPDAVIGVAWPSVRAAFALPQGSLGLVLAGSATGYFLSSFFAGRLIHRWGIGSLLAASSALVAASSWGFALSPAWPVFIACALVQGLGSGAVDAGLNSFGAAHFSARHMNWLHACYGAGAMLGPLLMTAAISGSDSWRAGYATLGTIMLLLTLLFTTTRRGWENSRPAPSAGNPSLAEHRPLVTTLAALRRPLVWLQIVLFFVYTGLEVMVGQWSYSLLTEARGLKSAEAGTLVSLYWGSIGVGRLLLGIVVEHVGIDRLLRISTITAVAGALVFATAGGALLSSMGLCLLGLSLAPIFPGLMSRTPRRLGQDCAAHAIGFQVSAATIGGAALPGIAGIAAQRFGLSAVPTAIVFAAGALLLLHEGLLFSTRGSNAQ